MAQFEAVSVVDDAVAPEQSGAARSRARLGLAASGGFLLAAAALMALIGNTGKATQVMKELDVVSTAENLKNKIDENNKKIRPLIEEVNELLEQGNWSKVADYAYNIYSLEQENERNKALLAKVEKAKQSILTGDYDTADTDIDVIKQDECGLITMNQISKMKMDAKAAVDGDNMKRMTSDIEQIQNMYSRCEDDGGATGNASEDSKGGNATGGSAAGNSTEDSAAGNSTQNSTTGNATEDSKGGNTTGGSAAGNSTEDSAVGNSTQNSTTGNASEDSKGGNTTGGSAAGNSTEDSAAGNSTQNSTTSNATENSSAGKATGGSKKHL